MMNGPTAANEIERAAQEILSATDFEAHTDCVPVTVFVTGANHGYPWRSVCPCGWASRGYAARHAADTMGAEHECPAR